MRTLAITKAFKRDAKHYAVALVTSPQSTDVLLKLLNDEMLDKRYCDHALTGNLIGYRDCHVKPDLVLIYQKYDNILELVRIGSHSELDL